MAPEPEFGNGRRLDAEFSNSPTYFKQLTTRVIEALTHPNETIRTKRKKELEDLEIVYSLTTGALQLKKWASVIPPSVRHNHVCERRIISGGIIGDGVYVGLADPEGRESVAYLCEINNRQLQQEGVTIHPFSLPKDYLDSGHQRH